MALGLNTRSVLLVLLLVWPGDVLQAGKRNGAELTQHKAEMRVATLDWLQGYSELTIFGAESRYRDAITRRRKNCWRTRKSTQVFTGLASALLLLANGWTLVLMLWLRRRREWSSAGSDDCFGGVCDHGQC